MLFLLNFLLKRSSAYAALCCAAALLPVIFSQDASSQSAARGTVYDNLSMHSDILDGERKYAVYLPPDYDVSERSYPVLYLLHGAGDDQTGWIQFGEVRHIADKAFAKGMATPMVIVMPDANTGRRGYFNTAGGDWRYEDFFFEELMPYVESTYRIKGEKQFRAVAGLSMGGGGSFMYAMHRPRPVLLGGAAQRVRGAVLRGGFQPVAGPSGRDVFRRGDHGLDSPAQCRRTGQGAPRRRSQGRALVHRLRG